MAETARPVALALHGGAGVVRGRDYQKQLRHMSELVELGRDKLAAGGAVHQAGVQLMQPGAVGRGAASGHVEA